MLKVRRARIAAAAVGLVALAMTIAASTSSSIDSQSIRFWFVRQRSTYLGWR